jgi:hypothetical protein
MNACDLDCSFGIQVFHRHVGSGSCDRQQDPEVCHELEEGDSSKRPHKADGLNVEERAPRFASPHSMTWSARKYRSFVVTFSLLLGCILLACYLFGHPGNALEYSLR